MMDVATAGRVMIVAAEASSGLFAQRLLEHWKKQNKNIQAFGVGTLAMEQLGFERLGKSEDMAVVGVAEIIEHWSHLKAVFNALVEQAIHRKPDVVVLMDYPEFNLRLARKLHAQGIPVVYYISPQVWAWRKGRVETIKKFCDKVFVLFPFEVAFYQEKGVPCEFVGHPILDEMDPKFLDAKYQTLQRQRRGIQDNEILIGLMPGSRRSELAHHLSTQIEVARRLYQAHPQVKFLFLVAPTIDKDMFLEMMGDVRFPYILLKEDPLEMISLTDVILAASGTATLMVGLLQKPMVIMYRMKWITGVIAKVLVRGVKFFGIVNLISGEEIVPERWQEGASVETLFALMNRYLVDPNYTEEVRQKLQKLPSFLGSTGATARVAAGLEKYFAVKTQGAPT